jgi:hypothetical protein
MEKERSKVQDIAKKPPRVYALFIYADDNHLALTSLLGKTTDETGYNN